VQYLSRTLAAIVIGFLALSGTARAALTIEITQGVVGALPIAVVPFGWEGPATAHPPEDIAAIIANNLRRSGRFSPMPEKDMLARPRAGNEVNFRDWRALGMESLVVGRVRTTGAGLYEVQFQLFDVFKGTQMTGYSMPVRGGALRRAAHHISDLIYEQLTGEPGAFNTRIAYVAATRGANPRYRLQVADSDGHNQETIVESDQPIMSPAWSPDGTRLAYVSFERRRAEVFVQDVASGARESVAAYPGINGAPAWSPDGRRLALTLSKDGSPDIYVLDLATKALTRVTADASIDTEAAWMPDGRSLIFTSDRGGRPQLYRVAANGGRAERVTFEGDYNGRARISPDGRRVAMVHRQGGNFRIAVMDLESRALRVLSEGRLDESPSFAPNGGMVIYATEAGGRGILSVVSVDGRVRQRLELRDDDVREPTWSTYRR
jgi:TolB protein